MPLLCSLEVVTDDLLQVNVYLVTGGHEVVEVHALHEGLNLRALLDLRLAHCLCDLPRIPLDAGDYGVGKLAVPGALVIGFDDDGLLAGVTAGKEDDHLLVLDDPLFDKLRRREIRERRGE